MNSDFVLASLVIRESIRWQFIPWPHINKQSEIICTVNLAAKLYSNYDKDR